MPLENAAQPKGLLRLLLRLPLCLYRLRLGCLLGNRFLKLVHSGRRTGKRRQTVLEVVAYDEDSGEYLVGSAWGKRADWFRNVQVNPGVQISVGGSNFEALAEPLPADRAAAALADYADRNPLAFRVIAKLMTGRWLKSGDAGDLADVVPIVILKPRRQEA